MEQKKLKIEQIKLRSFVTSLNSTRTIKAGREDDGNSGMTISGDILTCYDEFLKKQ